MTTDHPTHIMILLSGRGSNFIALHDYLKNSPQYNDIKVSIASDNKNAQGFLTAQARNLPTLALDYSMGKKPAETTLKQYIKENQVSHILLAGFMRILSKDFIDDFDGMILNIHPSLLPRHKGLDTHAHALSAGDEEHGCSVHLVTAEVDGGEVLAQKKLTIRPDDTADTLAKRVLALEHKLYPQVLAKILSTNGKAGR